MDRQGRAPEQGPNVVALAVVGGLVGEHMAEHSRVRRRFRGDVHRRAEDAGQAGGGQTCQGIDRQGALRRQRNPEPPQPPGKAQVGEQERRRHRRRPRQPNSAQQSPGIQRPPGRRSGGFLPGGGGEGLDGLPCRVPLGRVDFFHRGLGPPGKRLNHGKLREHPGRFHRGGEELSGHQKPGQDHRPKGIAQPGADPPPERRPQEEYRKDQKGSRPYPVPQKDVHCPPPFSAWSRIARSSVISSWDNSCLWAMALIIIPTLPR